eukprot:GHVS01076474.1.p1 GENE.GHVS01076474.1~~GHVS01076474.1.p1  ORF type:complete len:510 (-),score=74.97 GHVS01076474.1:227-1756(-)
MSHWKTNHSTPHLPPKAPSLYPKLISDESVGCSPQSAPPGGPLDCGGDLSNGSAISKELGDMRICSLKRPSVLDRLSYMLGLGSTAMEEGGGGMRPATAESRMSFMGGGRSESAGCVGVVHDGNTDVVMSPVRGRSAVRDCDMRLAGCEDRIRELRLENAPPPHTSDNIKENSGNSYYRNFLPPLLGRLSSLPPQATGTYNGQAMHRQSSKASTTTAAAAAGEFARMDSQRCTTNANMDGPAECMKPVERRMGSKHGRPQGRRSFSDSEEIPSGAVHRSRSPEPGYQARRRRWKEGEEERWSGDCGRMSLVSNNLKNPVVSTATTSCDTVANVGGAAAATTANNTMTSWVGTMAAFSVDLCRIAIAVLGFWFMCAVASMVFTDFSTEVQTTVTKAKVERDNCRRSYFENRCAPQHRPPILSKQCNEWEVCMTKDTEMINNRAELLITIVAKNLDAFVAGLSLRSIAVVVAVAVVSNTLISCLARSFLFSCPKRLRSSQSTPPPAAVTNG